MFLHGCPHYRNSLGLLTLKEEGRGRVVSRWCLGCPLVVSRWWVGGISVVSRSCLSGISVVSWWCLGGVLVVSLCVLVLSRKCLGGVSLMFVCCGVLVVSWWCLGSVSVVSVSVVCRSCIGDRARAVVPWRWCLIGALVVPRLLMMTVVLRGGVFVVFKE